MGLPTITQTWTHSINNRLTPFVSLLATTGAVLFSLIGTTGFLTSTMGYTCKGSCDGTTGAMDGVNRISAVNKWAVRNNGAAGAQSWIVLTDGAGIDWCFSFNSANDDVVRLAHSVGGNYVAAGTPAQQPTATDECFDAASGSWINATTSLDRVWNMHATTDKKMWRLAVMRNGALAAFIAGEKFISSLIAPATLVLTSGGGTQPAIKSYYNGANLSTQLNASYSSIASSDLARCKSGGADSNVKASLGGEMPGGGVGAIAGTATQYNAEKPALQGGTGELLFPAQLGSITASVDGKLGSKIDHWYAITASGQIPALVDTFGTLQLIAYWPGIIIPMDGVTTPVSV